MYWTIEGVNFMYVSRAGLRLSWVQHVTVKNVEAGYNNVWGIFTDFSNYLTISNVNCHHSATQHGIYISNTCGNEVCISCHLSLLSPSSLQPLLIIIIGLHRLLKTANSMITRDVVYNTTEMHHKALEYQATLPERS